MLNPKQTCTKRADLFLLSVLLAFQTCMYFHPQEETGGFTEFVPLSFVASEAPRELDVVNAD